MDVVDEFLAVNRKLFELLSDDDAKAHIASLSHPAARDLAESLYNLVRIEREIAKNA